MFEAIAGYGLGGSSIALFGRVGGGIYTKAADVGADLSGKNDYGMDEDSDLRVSWQHFGVAFCTTLQMLDEGREDPSDPSSKLAHKHGQQHACRASRRVNALQH
eukprot:4419908-Amphidinium_carterae.1